MTERPQSHDTSSDGTLSSKATFPHTRSSKDSARMLLHLVARDARVSISKNAKGRLGGGANPHIQYLAEIEHVGDSILAHERATVAVAEQHRHQAQNRQPYRAQFLVKDRAHRENKVFRVWIPLDPNSNPNLEGEFNIASQHHKSRQGIERMIEDQIDATQNVFKTMRSATTRFPTAASLDWDALTLLRQAHVVKSLRLKGVEVTEYVEGWERIEVYFENPGLKMRIAEDESPKVWREKGEGKYVPVPAADSRVVDAEAVDGTS